MTSMTTNSALASSTTLASSSSTLSSATASTTMSSSSSSFTSSFSSSCSSSSSSSSTYVQKKKENFISALLEKHDGSLTKLSSKEQESLSKFLSATSNIEIEEATYSKGLFEFIVKNATKLTSLTLPLAMPFGASTITSLKTLSLTSLHVTVIDKGALQALGELPLSTLCVQRNSELNEFPKIPKLTSLSVLGPITDTTLEALHQYSGLTSLDLNPLATKTIEQCFTNGALLNLLTKTAKIVRLGLAINTSSTINTSLSVDKQRFSFRFFKLLPEKAIFGARDLSLYVSTIGTVTSGPYIELFAQKCPWLETITVHTSYLSELFMESLTLPLIKNKHRMERLRQITIVCPEFEKTESFNYSEEEVHILIDDLVSRFEKEKQELLPLGMGSIGYSALETVTSAYDSAFSTASKITSFIGFGGKNEETQKKEASSATLNTILDAAAQRGGFAGPSDLNMDMTKFNEIIAQAKKNSSLFKNVTIVFTPQL